MEPGVKSPCRGPCRSQGLAGEVLGRPGGHGKQQRPHLEALQGRPKGWGRPWPDSDVWDQTLPVNFSAFPPSRAGIREGPVRAGWGWGGAWWW